MLLLAASQVLTLKNMNMLERDTSTIINVPVTADLDDCVMLYHITAGMPPFIPLPFLSLYGIFVFSIFFPPFMVKHNADDMQSIKRSIPVWRANTNKSGEGVLSSFTCTVEVTATGSEGSAFSSCKEASTAVMPSFAVSIMIP